MIRRPRFKTELRVRALADDLVAATSGQEEWFIDGHLCPLIIAHIDGQRTSEEILERLRGSLTALDLEVGLAVLEDRGWIVEATPEDLPELTSDLGDSLEIDPKRYAHRLAETTFSFHTTGTLDTTEVAEQMESFGLRLANEGEIAIVITDDYQRAEIGRFEARFRSQKKPWVLLKPGGRVTWLGPLFDPGVPGCWTCLTQRLRANRLSRTQVDLQLAPAPLSANPLSAQLAVAHLVNHLAGDPPGHLHARLLSIDPARRSHDLHHLVPLPDCNVCFPDGIETCAQPILLEHHQPVQWRDGGLRTVDPETTWRQYRPLVSPLTGVVASVSPYGGDSSGPIHVFQADHLFPTASDAFDASRVGNRRLSAGKGVQAVQARAGALCEALERYSGVFRGDEPRRQARFSELGDEATDPRLCLHFSDQQLANRAEWNRDPSIYTWVPQAFDEDREVDWTQVWSLTRETFVYLPTAFCYYACPLPEDHRFCRADSNGNAAGNTLEEAILQGFLELVERDAVAIWWYNQIRRPGLDLESFDDPALSEISRYYESLGRSIHLLDVTSDSEIPTIAATSWDLAGNGDTLLLGFGAHFDPTLAACRALTEMNQFLPGALAHSERRLISTPPENLDYLQPDTGQPSRRLSDYQQIEQGDVVQGVRRCVATAQAMGLELLVLDQTRADIGLPVVKVVVPGLRHYWARFGPGRLGQVPVTLGWLPDRRGEAEFNSSWIII